MNKKIVYGVTAGVLVSGILGGVAAMATHPTQVSVPKSTHPATSVVVPKSTPTTQAASTTVAPTTTQAPVMLTAPPTTSAAPTVRAKVDPTFTQNPSNPLEVTFAYSASITDGTLPTGTLSLTVSVPGQVSVAGGCTMNVGGTTYGGNCTVTLPNYGDWQVTTTYAGATSGSTATEVVNIPGTMPTTTTTGAPVAPGPTLPVFATTTTLP